MIANASVLTSRAATGLARSLNKGASRAAKVSTGARASAVPEQQPCVPPSRPPPSSPRHPRRLSRPAALQRTPRSVAYTSYPSRALFCARALTRYIPPRYNANAGRDLFFRLNIRQGLALAYSLLPNPLPPVRSRVRASPLFPHLSTPTP